MFLYDLSHFSVGVIVIGFTVAAALAGYFLVHRFFRLTLTEDQKAVAMAVLPIIATVHSLLLAFSAVSVWESFSAAETAVAQEATVIAQMGRDLSVFDSAESKQARILLKDYAETVIEVEWPEMKHGRASEVAWDKFDTMFRVVATVRPDTPQRQLLMPELWTKTNALVELRRERIEASGSEIPGTLWTVVIIGTVLTFLISYVLPVTRFNVVMLAMLACSIGLVFFFLIAMDRPFAGRESVPPDPFSSAIANMDRWDQTAPR